MSKKILGIDAENPLTNPLSGCQYSVWLVVGLLLAILPLLVIKHLPLADYPNHLARVFVWLVNDTAQKVPNLKLVWALQPNMAFDLIVGGLAQIMPLEVAGRVFIVLTIVSMVLGPAILSRTIHGSFSWLSLLALLFVYNRIFFWGFLGYLFSLGLAIALSALWVRYEPKKLFLFGYPARAMAALIVLGCHLYAFGILCLLVVFLILRELNLPQIKKDSRNGCEKFYSKNHSACVSIAAIFIFFTSIRIRSRDLLEESA